MMTMLPLIGYLPRLLRHSADTTLAQEIGAPFLSDLDSAH
jgi:hypothetical protein